MDSDRLNAEVCMMPRGQFLIIDCCLISCLLLQQDNSHIMALYQVLITLGVDGSTGDTAQQAKQVFQCTCVYLERLEGRQVALGRLWGVPENRDLLKW